MFELKNSCILFCDRPLGKISGEPEFRIIPKFFEAADDGTVEIGEAGAIGVKVVLDTVDFEFAQAFDAAGKPIRRQAGWFRRFGQMVLLPEAGARPCCFPVARLCRDSFWDKKSRKLQLIFEIRPSSGGNYMQMLGKLRG